jgi:PPOX class probable F420-dependent enzyme
VEREQMREKLSEARVARLATVGAGGRPHLVPCCFVLDGDVVYTAVDDLKAKSTLDLRRVGNVEANPAVSLLVDHYDDDWSALWWVRVDGTARVVDRAADRAAPLDQLAAKYPQYRDRPPPGALIAVTIEAWRGWCARTPLA